VSSSARDHQVAALPSTDDSSLWAYAWSRGLMETTCSNNNITTPKTTTPKHTLPFLSCWQF